MDLIERNEALAVALLAIGVLLFANPAYTGGQASGNANTVQVASEIDPDTLSLSTVAQLNSSASVLPVVEYERLSQGQRSVFDTGRNGVYVIRQRSDAEDAVLRSGVLYNGNVYLRQTQETNRGVELQYRDISGEVGTILVGTSLMSTEQRSAFRNATDSEGVNLTVIDAGLSAYDYVYDNETGTYYGTTTDIRGNSTVFSANEIDVRGLIDPAFVETSEMNEDVREAVVAAIDGEGPVVTGSVRNQVQQNRFVKHEGGYYQLGFGEASVPISEALNPLNYAGMALGVLFIAAGGVMVRRVLREKA